MRTKSIIISLTSIEGEGHLAERQFLWCSRRACRCAVAACQIGTTSDASRRQRVGSQQWQSGSQRQPTRLRKWMWEKVKPKDAIAKWVKFYEMKGIQQWQSGPQRQPTRLHRKENEQEYMEFEFGSI